MASIDENNAGTYIQSEIDKLVEHILHQMDVLGEASVANDTAEISVREKRVTVRVPIDLLLGLRLIQLNGKDVPLPRPVEFKCKDISLGGVQLSSCVNIPGEDIRFALIAPLRDELLYCWVKVAWVKWDLEYYRYGCKFVEMPEPEEMKLRFFVADEQRRLEQLREERRGKIELYKETFIATESHLETFNEYVVLHKRLPTSPIRAESLPDILRRVQDGPAGGIRSHLIDKGKDRWYK